MSSPPPPGGSSFERLLQDLLRMLQTGGPVQWDMARQWAHAVATDGQPERNVEPLERIQLEELARVAELQVSQATGLETPTGLVSVRPVTRSEWASRTLSDWRPLLESLAAALSRPSDGETEAGGGEGRQAGTDMAGGPEPASSDVPGFGGVAGFAGLLGSLGEVMGPVLVGLQLGSSIGYLARRAFGQYDLPVPREPKEEVLVVAANVGAFAEDWSLPADEVRLYVCLDQLAHHVVLSQPHVRDRLMELLASYAGGFQLDQAWLEERLSEVDPSDLESFRMALGDPTALLGERQSPDQARLSAQLEAAVLSVEGYVDHVVDEVGHRLIASYGALSEAVRRRRVERGEGERFVEQLFGLELGQRQYERAGAFVRGVLTREGEAGLAALWRSARNLPTPAEIDAPGLWLERIKLPDPDA
jgi:putative hydrolase